MDDGQAIGQCETLACRQAERGGLARSRAVLAPSFIGVQGFALDNTAGHGGSRHFSAQLLSAWCGLHDHARIFTQLGRHHGADGLGRHRPVARQVFADEIRVASILVVRVDGVGQRAHFFQAGEHAGLDGG